MTLEKKKALVVVSFGTSYIETRKKTIEACEKSLSREFSDFDFYRAWTSRMIIKKLKIRDNEHIMFPDELLEKLYTDGYEEVYIQSLHLICGEEYNKLLDIVEVYRGKFKKIIVGRPLLTSLEDYDDIVDFISETCARDTEKDGEGVKSATVWMGHGTDHIAHSAYAALDYRLKVKDIPSYVGTVEGYPELDEVISFLKKDGIKKVHLRPFLLVAGDHAQNDMAGEDDDSWLNILKKEGYDVEVHLEGIGEFESIQNKFVENLKEEIDKCLDNEKIITEGAKFFGIGVGPGDSDLVTVKAVKTLQQIDVLYVPQAKKGGDSLAKSIVNSYLKPNLEIKERHFPMNYNLDEKTKAWDDIASEIVEDVKSGKNVGFITVGDPMIYSTYVYLFERVRDEIEVVTIPGITSFINISSSNNFPLVMDRESLAIISCTDDYEKISRTLDEFESIVLMKVYKNFKEIVEMIIEKNLDKNAIVVSNSSQMEEVVYRDLNKVKNLDSVSYFTTILINKEWE